MILISLLSIPSAHAQIPTKAPPGKVKPELPKEKETILGLYVTSREAFERPGIFLLLFNPTNGTLK